MKTTLLINFGINQLRRSLTDERIDISLSIRVNCLCEPLFRRHIYTQLLKQKAETNPKPITLQTISSFSVRKFCLKLKSLGFKTYGDFNSLFWPLVCNCKFSFRWFVCFVYISADRQIQWHKSWNLERRRYNVEGSLPVNISRWRKVPPFGFHGDYLDDGHDIRS